jgi:hypothetical protein
MENDYADGFAVGRGLKDVLTEKPSAQAWRCYRAVTSERLCWRLKLCRRLPSAQTFLCRRLSCADGLPADLAETDPMPTAPTFNCRHRGWPSAPCVFPIVVDMHGTYTKELEKHHQSNVPMRWSVKVLWWHSERHKWQKLMTIVFWFFVMDLGQSHRDVELVTVQ